MADTRSKHWARRLGAVHVARVALLPRHVAALRAGHAELERRVAFLEAELGDVRRRAGDADDAIARLTATSSALQDDLAESRRLSLRVAQMTDVVMDRLAASPTTAAP